MNQIVQLYLKLTFKYTNLRHLLMRVKNTIMQIKTNTITLEKTQNQKWSIETSSIPSYEILNIKIINIFYLKMPPFKNSKNDSLLCLLSIFMTSITFFIICKSTYISYPNAILHIFFFVYIPLHDPPSLAWGEAEEG